LSEPARRPEVVLVGAGHTHALVLESWAKRTAPEARLTLVTDRETLLYSGMIPGVIAGEYDVRDATIDAFGVGLRAGARLVSGRVVHVDPVARRITLEGGGTLDYDVASLDVGSVPAGLSRMGDAVVAAKPLGPLRGRLETLQGGVVGQAAPRCGPRPDPESTTGSGAQSGSGTQSGSGGSGGSGVPSGSRAPVVVVGGGAAGVEISAAVRACLDGRSVILVERGDRLLPTYRPRISARVLRALRRRGIEVRFGTEVRAADEGRIHLASGGALPSALTIWVTGAAAPPLLRASPLPVDAGGFVSVGDDLRVLGTDDLFAAGDCASLPGAGAPKAGVHAVRQAPVLLENLWARLRGRSLTRYEPQRDFLMLLNLGDGTALGTKWGIVAEGRWVRRLKDVIDRRFVERFRG